MKKSWKILALNLVDYEEFISAEKIHSLIAIASASNRSFAVCSQSFIKLENLEEISEENRNCYHKLAMEIFSKFVIFLFSQVFFCRLSFSVFNNEINYYIWILTDTTLETSDGQEQEMT